MTIPPAASYISGPLHQQSITTASTLMFPCPQPGPRPPSCAARARGPPCCCWRLPDPVLWPDLQGAEVVQVRHKFAWLPRLQDSGGKLEQGFISDSNRTGTSVTRRNKCLMTCELNNNTLHTHLSELEYLFCDLNKLSDKHWQACTFRVVQCIYRIEVIDFLYFSVISSHP